MKSFIACVSVVAFLSAAGNAGANPSRFDASVPRAKQIELAMGAAPREISSRATIYVLSSRGFEVARTGSNGFSCLVDRQVQGKAGITLEPKCFDPEGTRTFLPVSLRTEALRAQGKTESQIADEIAASYKRGVFHAPRKPGLIYMMSRYNVIALGPNGTNIKPVPGHLMFYAPYMTLKDLGYDANSRNMLPVLVDPGTPFAMMIVVPKRQLPK